MVPPRALTIAGSDSGGGAGIQADLKTFLACGVHGMSALTAATAQNSLGVSGVWELPPAAVTAQISAVVSDIGVDAVKTGMLSSEPIIDAVATALRSVDAPVVVDPVAASQHGNSLLEPSALHALTSLILPLATVATPNLGEVALLTGVDVRSRADMADAARAVHDLGPRWVLIKGGHLEDGSEAVDLLFDGSSLDWLSAPRVATSHTHGSGCTLAAAIASGLARGLDVPGAVRFGKAYISAAVTGGYPLGSGLGPVGHFWRVRDVDFG